MTQQLTVSAWVKAAFGILLLAIFGILNLVSVQALRLSFSPLGIVYAWLLELAFFALAYDTGQALLCLVLREFPLPSLSALERFPPVALLCTTCDDADTALLCRFSRQTYRNLDLFILDDSQRTTSHQVIDALGLKVIRRGDRRGYKAGNLNHWLAKYASSYEFFVVADADSILPDDFIESMVRVAEHPRNRTVAIIESLVHYWNEGNPFARAQAPLAAFQRCRQLRLLNRIDATLSVGHNNLYRTEALLAVKGFPERYIAEDYATTVNLLRTTEWKCRTASVRSYERAPSNLAEYARRQSRWAYQTFQLGSLTTMRLPWETRLALLRALYHFSLPVMAYIGMCWLIVANAAYWPAWMSGATSWPGIQSLVAHPAFAFWMVCLLAPPLLRLALLAREGVPPQVYLHGALSQAGLFFASAWPVLRRLAGFRHPNRQAFEVTGRSLQPSFLTMVKMCGPGLVLAWLTLLSFAPAPHLLALNLVWLFPACASPLLLRGPGGFAGGVQEDDASPSI